MSQGTLYIIMAPSGAGKTSLVKALIESPSNDNLCVSISHTTRAIRPGEVDGLNYHFVNQTAFIRQADSGDFLESARVYGNFYGTSKQWVNQQTDAGRDVILEIDWQGATQVRKKIPQACAIFILPPSLESLRSRLTNRGQDDKETIEKRMQQAVEEISHVSEADYVVINDDFDLALTDLQAIIRSRQLHRDRQQAAMQHLLEKISS
ncbi:MAG: guanylate kinase [SAR86 cluster bacterium]|uniref:Guanylate kinase n=1 Tax=SAR86 cluster bacterium TaxID=2030880 RepID=A0A2A4MTN4_9GAMM|nr:MAG: guanylate kinase [SAR86 cluster bacterium]